MEPRKFIFVTSKLNETNLKKLLNLNQTNDFQLFCFSKNDFSDIEDQKANNISLFPFENLKETKNTLINEQNISPDKSVLISDDPKTIKFFRTNGWGYLIGYGQNKRAFYSHYADKVIQDFDNLDINTVNEWFKTKLRQENWCINYNYFDEGEEKLRETITTVGNGFVGNRGSLSFMKADKETHYPGTYIAGLFNKVGTEIEGKTIYNNDFVNIPNAFLIQFKFGNDQEFWSLNQLNISSYNHQLNMRTGEVKRKMILEHSDGRQVKYICSRFAAMHDMHTLGHKVSITPLNFKGELQLSSCIDGDIINSGVARYRKLNSNHLNVKATTANKNYLSLEAETTNSQIAININVYHESLSKGHQTNSVDDKSAEFTYKEQLEENQSFNLERTIFIETSRNKLEKETIKRALNYDLLLQASAEAWKVIWDKVDIEIDGDRYAQQLIRLQMYHLISSASPNNINLDAATTARGLHGEAYRGHIFWDEIFILPFYFKHFPEVSRALLMYRYRRLDAARENAKKNNKAGALIPWQIADTGEEETQEIHYNPLSKEWDPDLSRKQRHVSISVAFNIINYFHHTQDHDFIKKEGGEMLLEIIRYWASKVKFNSKDNRYHITGIMGPDEFHEKYPDKTVHEGGLDDNAYTNLMVSWLFKRCTEILPLIGTETKKHIRFEENTEKDSWLDISKHLYISIKDDILEQFEGYFKLKEIDLDKYEEKYEDVERMDRILKSENDSPDNYKVAKQADTLMLFYLLEPEEVKSLIENLGYQITNAEQLLKKNFDYYIKRTSHGSTLSYIVHAYLLDYFPERKDQLWQWFQKSLSSDFDDIQGGTTKEGIHCGVMSGNISLIYNCFAGIKMGEPIKLKPNLPDHWKSINLKIRFQKQSYWFRITKSKIRISTEIPHERTVLYKGEKFSFKESSDIIIKV